MVSPDGCVALLPAVRATARDERRRSRRRAAAAQRPAYRQDGRHGVEARPRRAPGCVRLSAALPRSRRDARGRPKGERFMFLIRDPLSRFVSAFNGRLREDRPRYHYPWREEERSPSRSSRHRTSWRSRCPQPMTDERAHAERAMQGIGHVNTPYTFWFPDEDAFRARLDDVFFIGLQDRLDEDFELLKDKLRPPGGCEPPARRDGRAQDTRGIREPAQRARARESRTLVRTRRRLRAAVPRARTARQSGLRAIRPVLSMRFSKIETLCSARYSSTARRAPCQYP